jgi:hypothetical protein
MTRLHVLGDRHTSALGKEKPDKKKEKPACGSCYGAELNPNQCCNTCAEIREAYRVKGWALNNAETMDQVGMNV